MPVAEPVSAPKVNVRVMALIRCTAAVFAPGRTIAYSGENPRPVIDLLVPLPVYEPSAMWPVYDFIATQWKVLPFLLTGLALAPPPPMVNPVESRLWIRLAVRAVFPVIGFVASPVIAEVRISATPALSSDLTMTMSG